MEQTIISINPAHVKLIRPCYDAWSSFWNGGEGFESLEEYLDCAAYTDCDRKIIEENFDKFHDLILEYDWTILSFVEVLNRIYPDINAEIVNIDKTILLEY